MNTHTALLIAGGIFCAWSAFVIIGSCAAIALIEYVGRGESDVNGAPERDAGILK